MRNNKAQVLVIGLWILVILAILVTSVSHRVSLALRISQYRRDRLVARSLATAALRRAIAEVRRDSTPDYDTVFDSWSDNEEAFREIRLSESQKNYASVSFVDAAEDPPRIRYGVRDEEAKINVNTASEAMLVALFEEFEIADAENLARNLLMWRGDIPDDAKVYEDAGFPCKGKKLSTIFELILVKDLDHDAFLKIKDLVTVYGNGRLSINTAPPEVFDVWANGLGQELGYPQSVAQNVATKILELRRSKGYFKEKSGLDVLAWSMPQEESLFHALMDAAVLNSDNFLIEVVGNAGKIHSRISAVYCRSEDKILFWHGD